MIERLNSAYQVAVERRKVIDAAYEAAELAANEATAEKAAKKFWEVLTQKLRAYMKE